MFTVTKDLMLPATITGSWPRPHWFDVSMWGKSLDACMLQVAWREKFQDALAVVISEQERAGLDILSHGDFHCDEDMAGIAIYLASRAGAYVTGTVIPVDGGMSTTT